MNLVFEFVGELFSAVLLERMSLSAFLLLSFVVLVGLFVFV